VCRNRADQLIDGGLRVSRAPAGAVGEHRCAELAQQHIGPPVRLRLVEPGLAFLSCFLGLLRELVRLRLDLVHQSHVPLQGSGLGRRRPHPRSSGNPS